MQGLHACIVSPSFSLRQKSWYHDQQQIEPSKYPPTSDSLSASHHDWPLSIRTGKKRTAFRDGEKIVCVPTPARCPREGRPFASAADLRANPFAERYLHCLGRPRRGTGAHFLERLRCHRLLRRLRRPFAGVAVTPFRARILEQQQQQRRATTPTSSGSSTQTTNDTPPDTTTSSS